MSLLSLRDLIISKNASHILPLKIFLSLQLQDYRTQTFTICTEFLG